MNATIDTIDSVIEQLVQRAKERRCTVSEAFDPKDLEALDDANLKNLARRGLLDLANDAIHRERATIASLNGEEKPPSTFTADGRNPAARYDALAIVWTASDGTLKELSSFTIDDCESLRSECVAKEVGWRKKREWATKAQEVLRNKPKATTIEQLPKKAIAELRELAAGAGNEPARRQNRCKRRWSWHARRSGRSRLLV